MIETTPAFETTRDGSLAAVAAYISAHLSDDGGYGPATYHLGNPAVLHFSQEVNWIVQQALHRAGWTGPTTKHKSLLEVGCAWGMRLRQLLDFGFAPQNLHGIDIIPSYLAMARAAHSDIRFHDMSATHLAFADGRFDASLACVCLSAMPDDATVNAALAEMCRVSREFVLVIDNFDPQHRDRRNGAVYLRGLHTRRMEKVARREDVAAITCLRRFWTTNSFIWGAQRALARVLPDAAAYDLTVGLWPLKSHAAYLITLKQ